MKGIDASQIRSVDIKKYAPYLPVNARVDLECSEINDAGSYPVGYIHKVDLVFTAVMQSESASTPRERFAKYLNELIFGEYIAPLSRIAGDLHAVNFQGHNDLMISALEQIIKDMSTEIKESDDD